jgi:ketosteroid isomerase-like protein
MPDMEVIPMSDASAEVTNRLVDEYYARWGSGDLDRLAEILADDFQFSGPMDQADDAGSFVALIRRNAPTFGTVSFADVRRAVDGRLAVNLYTFVAGPARVPMAEAFEIRGDRIARVDLYFDPARFGPPPSGPRQSG